MMMAKRCVKAIRMMAKQFKNSGRFPGVEELLLYPESAAHCAFPGRNSRNSRRYSKACSTVFLSRSERWFLCQPKLARYFHPMPSEFAAHLIARQERFLMSLSGGFPC